jgi:hypothetical protein
MSTQAQRSAIALSVVIASVLPKDPQAQEVQPIPCSQVSHVQDVDLVVRMVNTEGTSGDHYKLRLKGTAQKFFEDWPYSVGVIGMQQVGTTLGCPEDPNLFDGVDCFGALIQKAFSTSRISKGSFDDLALVSGPPWDIVDRDHRLLGKDDFWKFGFGRGERHLLQGLVRHVRQGWTLHIYSTHLSHISDKTSQVSQRHEQIDRLIKHVRSQVKPGELPPIVIGDLNFYPNDEQSSYSKMNKDFMLATEPYLGCLRNGKPERVRKEQIWIGRRSSFPVDSVVLLRYHTDTTTGDGVRLKSPATVDGVRLNSLSPSHDSPGFSLKVVEPQYDVAVVTGSKLWAGTDAKVYISLIGRRGSSEERRLGYPGHNDFEQGQTDHISFYSSQERDLGDLSSIRIRHDNSGSRPDWFLDQVHVRDVATGKVFTFSCSAWLSTNHAPYTTDRSCELLRTGVSYAVIVHTDATSHGGTDAKVYLTLHGRNGVSPERRLGNSNYNDFERGNWDFYRLTLDDLGDITRARVRHDNSGANPGWHLASIVIRNEASGEQWTYRCNRWLALDKEGGHLSRNLDATGCR